MPRPPAFGSAAPDSELAAMRAVDLAGALDEVGRLPRRMKPGLVTNGCMIGVAVVGCRPPDAQRMPGAMSLRESLGATVMWLRDQPGVATT